MKLPPDEVRALRRVSNLRGAFALVLDLGLIAASMAAVALEPHPLVVLFALVIVGGRQLGLAVLMHEASHRTLFTHRGLNDLVGNWVCAYPMFVSMTLYRPYHLQHHAKAGSDDDPDLPLRRGLPLTKASFARKLLRDLTGITGLKRVIGTSYLLGSTAIGRPMPQAIGFVPANAAPGPARVAIVGFLVTNALMLGGLWALGHPLLYLVWAGAYLTTYSVVLRIRSLAEHAMCEENDDPLRNTRTIVPSPLEQLFIAPHLVGYHLEHHLLMTVPFYRLPALHAKLQQREGFEHARVRRGYIPLLRSMIL